MTSLLSRNASSVQTPSLRSSAPSSFVYNKNTTIMNFSPSPAKRVLTTTASALLSPAAKKTKKYPSLFYLTAEDEQREDEADAIEWAALICRARDRQAENAKQEAADIADFGGYVVTRVTWVTKQTTTGPASVRKVDGRERVLYGPVAAPLYSVTLRYAVTLSYCLLPICYRFSRGNVTSNNR